MSHYTEQLIMSDLKPIYINLVSGNYEIDTHNDLSVSLEVMGEKQDGLVPSIEDKGDHILISGQNLLKLGGQQEKLNVRISLPQYCDLTHKQLTGNVIIAGYFNSVNSKVTFGNIKTDLIDFILKKHATLKVFAGDIKFRIMASARVDIDLQRENALAFSLRPSGHILARTGMGNITVKRKQATTLESSPADATKTLKEILLRSLSLH